jgi:hypothetical protein
VLNVGPLVGLNRDSRGFELLTAKQLLLQQTAEAFGGRPDMSLLAALGGITQDEASWTPDAAKPSVEQLVRHVAWAKSQYCRQGFGQPMVVNDPTVNEDGDSAELPAEFPCGAAWGRKGEPGIAGAIRLLEQSHQGLTACLAACSDEALERPIPNRHGKSAAHFFWVMLMHDVYHAGQIRTRRTLYAWARPSVGDAR